MIFIMTMFLFSRLKVQTYWRRLAIISTTQILYIICNYFLFEWTVWLEIVRNGKHYAYNIQTPNLLKQMNSIGINWWWTTSNLFLSYSGSVCNIFHNLVFHKRYTKFLWDVILSPHCIRAQTRGHFYRSVKGLSLCLDVEMFFGTKFLLR